MHKLKGIYHFTHSIVHRLFLLRVGVRPGPTYSGVGLAYSSVLWQLVGELDGSQMPFDGHGWLRRRRYGGFGKSELHRPQDLVSLQRNRRTGDC